jgi:hypothetical protein
VAENFVSLAPATRDEAIGLVFDGKLKVPADGQYTFHLRSSEGVRLTVDGKPVIDRPGKGRWVADFTTTLKAGLLPFKLEYFNGYAKPQLSLAWSGPTSSGGCCRASRARRAARARCWPPTAGRRGSSGCTTSAPAGRVGEAAVQPEQWQQAPGGFGRKGTPGAVVRTEWATPEIYLRRDFTLERPPTTAALNLHHDEDVEVYINGVPAYKATGHVKQYTRVPVSDEAVRAMRKGRNVLAVHAKQTDRRAVRGRRAGRADGRRRAGPP